MSSKARDFGVVGTPRREKVRMLRRQQAALMRIRKAQRNGKAPTEKDMVLVYGPDFEGWDATMAKKVKA